MSLSRKSLVNLIYPSLNQFHKKQTVMDESKNLLQTRGLTTRVFNPLQDIQLAEHKEFKTFSADFFHLINSTLQSAGLFQDKFTIKNPQEIAQVEGWAKKLITTVLNNLLTEYGGMNKELLAYMHWRYEPSCFTRDRIEDIACSYFAILYQQVALSQQEIINLYLERYTSFDIFINKHYREWIHEAIEKKFNLNKNKAVENEAKEFANWLENLEETTESFNELEEIVKMDFHNLFAGQKEKLSFWLEILTRSTAKPNLFLRLWQLVSSYMSAHDYSLMKPFERDQYDFCSRYASTLKPSTPHESKDQLAHQLKQTFFVHFVNREKHHLRDVIMEEYLSLDEDKRLPGEFEILHKLLNQNEVQFYQLIVDCKKECVEMKIESGILFKFLDHYSSLSRFEKSLEISSNLKIDNLEEEYVIVPPGIVVTPTKATQPSGSLFRFSYFSKSVEQVTITDSVLVSNQLVR